MNVVGCHGRRAAWTWVDIHARRTRKLAEVTNFKTVLKLGGLGSEMKH